ncbi:reverse transcriptase/maturase family protein [Candidatus Pacearchaeota archaeon]|nr:reverse transcriptase/maturase family protein [Candidatus Pacearchaeota archaeon]
MKTYDNLYEEIVSLPNLYKAYFKAKKGKKNKDFLEFDKNLYQNLSLLHEELINFEYEPSGYNSFYVKDYKTRKILAPFFRDHILHHAIYNYLEEIYEKHFIFDSFACRKGKGTHFGLKRLKHFINKHSEEDYFIKCDISKYFYSIDHYKLKEILSKRIKDKRLLWLLGQIIGSSFQEKISAHIDNPNFSVQEKGIPIGNLLSQLFANVYLHELDEFVKENLGIKHYVRYVDDFVILEKEKNKLRDIVLEIKRFLAEELYLILEDKKIQINKIKFGVDFIGYVAFKKFIRVRSKNYRRFKDKMNLKINIYEKDFVSYEELKDSFSSYFAHLSYTNSEMIKLRIVAAIINRAVKRGGNWNNGANAGPFCANLNNAPTNTNYNIGFRCYLGFLALAEFLRKFCKLEMQLQLQSAIAENMRRDSPFFGGISPMNFNKEEVNKEGNYYK